MAKIINPVFDQGQKFVVCETSTAHSFTLNEIVSYVGSIKRMDGNVYHLVEGEDGRSDYLVDGEFELLPTKKLVGIALNGCDDSTMFNMELTDEQIEFLQEIVAISKKTSQYSCMPTMEVRDEPFELYEDENE